MPSQSRERIRRMRTCLLSVAVGAQISRLYAPALASYSYTPLSTYSSYSTPLPSYSYAPLLSAYASAPVTSSYYPIAASFSQPLSPREQSVMNVVKGVNYALSLENLESAFYRAVNGVLRSDSDYLALASNNGERFNLAVLHSRFLEIGAHEDAHVVTLTNLVSSLCSLIPTVPNCAPVSACTYTFDLGNVNTIVATADLLENTGVKAYDGAISSLIQPTPLSLDGSLTSASIVEAAATVATVEARHAAFLSTIRGLDPFPQAQDTPTKPNEILCAASKFVVNPSTCPVFNTVAC